MALYFIKDTTLKGIADAIRTKTGDSASIPVADFASEIESIVVGDGSSSGSGEGDIIYGYEVISTSGLFETGSGVTSETVTHNCGGEPDLVIVYLRRNDLTASADYNTWVYSTSKIDVGNFIICSGYASMGDSSISCADTTFTVTNLAESSRYGWYAMKLVDKEVSGGSGGDYTVTFMSEDGATILYEKEVMEHDDCANPVTYGFIDKPTKASTAQYTFGFVGWSTTQGGETDENALVNITEDRVVYASFVSVVRFYTIKYYDGDDLLQSELLSYGTMPSYVPEKAGYLFNGWDTEIVPVTEDANYYAQFIKDAKSNGTCGDNLTWILGNDGVLTISGTGDMYDYESNTMPWYDYNADITSVVIEDGVTSIGFYAFYGCGMTSISIPDGCILHTEKKTSSVSGVDNYNGHQFMYCTKLESLELPEGNTVIPMSMCNGCSSLESVTIPSTMVYIGEMAFMDTKLTSVTIPSNVTHINGRAFAISTLTSVVFEDTTTWAHWNYNSSYTSFEKKGNLASADLADPATAATYLNNTYKWNYWRKT